MTDTSAADDALRAATVTNIAAMARMATADKSYVNVWNKYVKWIKECPKIRATEPPFLTRTNIDHYFTRVIANKNVSANTAGRYVSALQWYADNLITEHASTGKGSFKVRDSATDSAKRTCQMLRKESGGKQGQTHTRG